VKSRSVELRVRGMVQGVGFRPTVWRIATELELSGEVLNDAEGVLIRLAGPGKSIETFARRIIEEAPRLACIDALEETAIAEPAAFAGFRIARSGAGVMATAIVPDAATCAECLAEATDVSQRRFRYPFTNCTHCGPRLTIIEAAPYDRGNTTMRGFRICADCRGEYADPADRRFHAQPIACARCGPLLALSTIDGGAVDALPGSDVIAAAADLIARGHIVAIKGLGGFHLACDATNDEVVTELRRRKRRFGKAFAVMMPDLEAVRRHCVVSAAEESLLLSRESPIVLLETLPNNRLPDAIAPQLANLGVMLPYTPLHHLLMRDFASPAVMTSGNLSDEPQCIDGTEARARLVSIADFVLDHDRPIVNRVDDSVIRIMAGRPAIQRRARGFAPAPLPLPDGFKAAPPVIAMGGELKAVFCLLKNGQAVLSQHLGDLENAPTFGDYRRTLDLYLHLFDHRPDIWAVDRHPDYLSRKLGESMAEASGLEVAEVQHHHAHIAACLADNGVPLSTRPVLGVALDGLGLGDDGTIWGGEFLLADYRSCRRVASLQPVAMPGGARAIREPWRNTLAQVLAIMDWSAFELEYGGTTLYRYLAEKPVGAIASMIRSGINAPLGSSCGRLFDAVAGALGVVADAQSYEGEAAERLEALVDPHCFAEMWNDEGYSFQLLRDAGGMPRLDPAPMWRSLLSDLASGASAAVISARFHKGVAAAVAGLASNLLREHDVQEAVALSGGSFQNRLLLEGVKRRLEAGGVRVLIHAKVPTNDGGLALGQAVVAAARSLADNS
jgi:hydrogenase maturation protein HypF